MFLAQTLGRLIERVLSRLVHACGGLVEQQSLGCPMSAAATSKRWNWPPERAPMGLPTESTFRPTSPRAFVMSTCDARTTAAFARRKSLPVMGRSRSMSSFCGT